MRHVTSNTSPMPWPAKILSEVQPRITNYTRCWAKRACKGAALPPERQTGGVCAKCVAPQKARSPIAVAQITNGTRGKRSESETVRTDYRIARRRGSEASNRSNKDHFKVSEADMPRAHGFYTLASGTVRHSFDMTDGVDECAAVKIRCKCGEERFTRRCTWTSASPPMGCKQCLKDARYERMRGRKGKSVGQMEAMVAA